MADPVHPSARGFVAKDLPGQYITGSGRLPSKVAVQYATLDGLLGESVAREIWSARTLDRATLPWQPGTAALDTRRIAAELARAPGPPLSTMVLTRAVAAKVYDLGLVVSGAPVPLCGGDPDAMDWSHLVGRVVPYFTQCPAKVTAESAAFRPLGDPGDPDGPDGPGDGADGPGDGADDGPHAFAFKPVVLSTAGGTDRGDHGEVLAQGIVVSPRVFNFPASVPGKRVSLGVAESFEETACFVLITHAYSRDHVARQLGGGGGSGPGRPGVPYACMNKPNKPRGKRKAPEDPWVDCRERIFKWQAYESFHGERLKEPGYQVGSFGLLTTKMTHKHAVRAMLPMPVAEVGALLAEMRDPAGPGLDHYLRELPMKQPGGRTTDVSGLDLRCMLMMECLLKNTPLECLLRGEAPSFDGGAPAVPSSAAMHEAMKRHADAHFV